MIQQRTDGYILVLTLMVMSALVVIATQIFYTGGNFSSFASYAYKREQAKWLALSGVSFAQNELFVPAPQKKSALAQQNPSAQKTTQKSEPDQNDQTKRLLQAVLPIINRWQNITFNTENDGFEGTLSIYISCEDGKIPINSILATLVQPKRDGKPLSADVSLFLDNLWQQLAKSLMTKEIGAQLQRLIIERNGILLNDVTELIAVQALEPLKNHFFVTKTEAISNKPPLFLSDLFTVHAQYAKLDPWVLSASVRAVFDLQASGEKKLSEKEATALATRAQLTQNWNTDWNTVLKPLYNKEYGALNKSLKDFIHDGPILRTFSIVSQATVGGVTQRVFFILTRRQLPDHSLVYLPISVCMC